MPIISANTDARPEGYFRLEWKLAVDRSHLMADHKAFLFPVILDDVSEANTFVPDKFRERQWTRLRDDGYSAAMGLGFRMKHLRDELTPCAASALVWR